MWTCASVLEDTIALRDYDLKVNNIIVERDFEPILPSIVADPISGAGVSQHHQQCCRRHARTVPAEDCYESRYFLRADKWSLNSMIPARHP